MFHFTEGRNIKLVQIINCFFVEIGVDTRIKIDTCVAHDRLDMFVKDKKKNLITLVEVGITKYMVS